MSIFHGINYISIILASFAIIGVCMSLEINSDQNYNWLNVSLLTNCDLSLACFWNCWNIEFTDDAVEDVTLVVVESALFQVLNTLFTFALTLLLPFAVPLASFDPVLDLKAEEAMPPLAPSAEEKLDDSVVLMPLKMKWTSYTTGIIRFFF